MQEPMGPQEQVTSAPAPALVPGQYAGQIWLRLIDAGYSLIGAAEPAGLPSANPHVGGGLGQ